MFITRSKRAIRFGQFHEYGVLVDELIEVNALDDVQGLMIGQLLYVPVPLPKSKVRETKRVIHPAGSPAAEQSTVSSSSKRAKGHDRRFLYGMAFTRCWYHFS